MYLDEVKNATYGAVSQYPLKKHDESILTITSGNPLPLRSLVARKGIERFRRTPNATVKNDEYFDHWNSVYHVNYAKYLCRA